MRKSTVPLVFAAAVLSAIVFTPTAVMAQPVELPAQAFGESRTIPGRYIVVFKDRVRNPAAEVANVMRGRGGQVHFTYTQAIKGFAATIPDAAYQAIRMNPNVEYIEPDMTVSLSATQSNPTWGLDRIDQRDGPLDAKYLYDRTGSGVYAFIIDTGILASHVDFGGRVETGATAISDGRGTSDCNGHGTHVAGTVGGTTWGVAKEVKLVPVRVLDCNGSGTVSGVIAGVEWVAKQTSRRPAVANMSLGGGASTALDAAVANTVSGGVTMVVAAGNSNANACSYSPARVPSAVTVGATTNTDARASYSNFGSCVDLFAPGTSIRSAWHTSNAATNTISGTSMASPHVAGVAALWLQANSGAMPADVTNAILDNATTGRVTSAGTGSPNLLAYSLVSGGAQPTPTPTATSTPTPTPTPTATATATATATPTPSPTPTPTPTLSGSSTSTGSTWIATVTLTGPSGVATNGTWSTGAGGGCTISSGTNCSFALSRIRKNVGSVSYSDSNGLGTVTITKP